MAWEKRIVTDQNVEFPNRFKIDGVSKTIEPDFGTIVDAGTPINKAYLQPIENFLEEIDNRQGTHEAEDAIHRKIIYWDGTGSQPATVNGDMLIRYKP